MTFKFFQVLDEGIFNRVGPDNTDASRNHTTSTTTTVAEGQPPQIDDQCDITTPSERLPDDSICIELRIEGLSLSDCERREISDSCAICLNVYQAGDEVVWSSNPQCTHVFHCACIEQWLLKKRAQGMCPCCRQPFIADGILDLEKGSL